MENSGLLNWKYVEVFVFDPAISPRSLVLGTFDEERSKERWLFSQARQQGKPVKYPDKSLSGYGKVPTINST